MNTKWRLFGFSFAATALMAGYLLVLPAASQTTQASAKPAANGDSSAGYMPGCCSTNEELQKFYLDLPQAKKPTPRAPDGHPDLSGFYNNPFAHAGEVKENGTVQFLFGGKRNPNGPRYSWPEPVQPSYKPEYAAKVEA